MQYIKYKYIYLYKGCIHTYNLDISMQKLFKYYSEVLTVFMQLVEDPQESRTV